MNRFIFIIGSAALISAASFLILRGFLSPKEGTAVKDFRKIRSVGGIEEYELLTNGLRTLLHENHSAPIAHVMVSYQVGTRNEVEGKTGGSHMLEHMMFKGTAAHNRKLGNSIFLLLQQVGAALNATTNMDITRYYVTLPSERVALAIELEADRMRGALLKEEDFQKEREVVINELEHMDNSPVTALLKTVWRTAYERHPYRNLAIGRKQDLEAMTVGQLADFYDAYYWPDNAYLTVVGDFEKEQILSVIHKHFSEIPRSPDAIPASDIREPEQTEERRVKVEKGDKTEAVLIAHKCPAGLHPDIPALEVLSGILSGGKTSRLYRELVDKGLVAQVSASASGFRDPGLFSVIAFLVPGVRHEDVERVIVQVYEDIRKNGVKGEELKTAKNILKAQAAFSWDGVASIANGLNEAIGAGDWTLFPDYEKKLNEVTAGDLRAAARKYLVPGKMTAGYLVSKPSDKSFSVETLEEFRHESIEEKGPAERVLLEEIPESRKKERTKFAERAKIQHLAGIKVITVKTEVRDVITLSGSFKGAGEAYAKDPLLASVTAAMLDLGTMQHDKFAIARRLESRGVDLTFRTDKKHVSFRARLLKEDIPETVALIAEQLRFPAFTEEEFQKVKQQFLFFLQDQMTRTDSLAFRALTRLVYSPAHPNYKPLLEDQLKVLEAMKVQDVRKFHEEHYGPQRLILVAVGDVESKPFYEAVRSAFDGWETKEVRDTFAHEVSLREPVRQVIEVKGKGNLDVFFGHALPLTRHHEDYHAAFLANYAFGGDFSSPLVASVRDIHGLTYSIYSHVNGIDEDIQGIWYVHMIATAPLLEEGGQRAVEEIRRYVRQGLGAKELKLAQNTVSGRFQVGLSTTRAIADQIRRSEEMDLGIAYVDAFPELIKDVDLESANRAISRYFHPDKLHLVIAGEAEKAGE